VFEYPILRYEDEDYDFKPKVTFALGEGPSRWSKLTKCITNKYDRNVPFKEMFESTISKEAVFDRM
jgi:predicted ATPase